MSQVSYLRRLNHQRIDFGRKVKLATMAALFSPFSQCRPAPSAAAIVVLRLDDKLGDSVSSTGFLRNLKNQNPENQLIVVCGISSYMVFKNLDFIDQIYKAEKGLLNTFLLYRKLRKHVYKYVINTSHILNPRSVFLVAMLRASRKIGFENFQARFFSDHVKIDFAREHVTDRYQNILKVTGEANYQSLDYQVVVDAKALERAQIIVDELRKQYRYIVALNSFAGSRLRNLNQATTIKLVKELAKNPDICVLSLASEGDHRLIKVWKVTCGILSWHAHEELSLLDDNIAFMQLCDVMITPDTAWVHIASALKKKLLAIYRADAVDALEKNEIIWAPYKTEFIKVVVASNDINDVQVAEVARLACKMLGLK